MVKFYDKIPASLIPWIQAQHLFWVASAPLSPTGHVNVSPKGMRSTLHIVNTAEVWYEDLTGSGSETIAHVRENGRITLCFVAFDGAPRVLRVFGTAVAHEFGTPEYAAYIPTRHERAPGSRAVIAIAVHKVNTSCGFGVPRFALAGERELMPKWGALKEKHDTDAGAPGAFGIRAWWREYANSLDGLPGLRSCFDAARPLEYAEDHVAGVHDAEQAVDTFLAEYKASGAGAENDEGEEGKVKDEAVAAAAHEQDSPEPKVPSATSDKTTERQHWLGFGFAGGLFAAFIIEAMFVLFRGSLP